MNQPNRNDPCSCGSGKKYKKCCGVPKQPKTFQAMQITKETHNTFLKHQFTHVSSLMKEQYEKQKEKIQATSVQSADSNENHS